MRWRGERQSENVEDRRGEGGGFGFPGGGVRFPSGGGGGGSGGGIGIVGLLIILGLMFFFGVDPSVILQGGAGGDGEHFPDIQLPRQRPDTTDFPIPRQQGPQVQRPQTTSEDDLKRFVSVVLADTEDVWNSLLSRYGERYSDPTLVLYSGGVRSACGTGIARWDRFIVRTTRRSISTSSFYEELKNRFRAPGDFAQAYVIAHEIGHHVQKLLGIMDQVEVGAAAHERAAGQCAPGARRAAGRLLRRRLGQSRRRRPRTSSSPATSRRR